MPGDSISMQLCIFPGISPLPPIAKLGGGYKDEQVKKTDPRDIRDGKTSMPNGSGTRKKNCANAHKKTKTFLI